MKTSVLRYRDRRASILTFEPSFRDGLRDLSMTGLKLVREQDPILWAKASDSGFLKKVFKGAVCLGKIASQKGPSVLLRDSAAHQAFICCMFMSTQAKRLCRQCRADLNVTLRILAECCPVDLPMEHLPNPSALHVALRGQSIMRKHYPAMQKAGCTYELTLADALRLFLVMKRAPAPGLIPIMAALSEVTEGLRTALQKTNTVSQ